MTILGEGAAFSVDVAASLRDEYVDSSCKSHVTFKVNQCFERVVYREKRRGTAGISTDTRSGKVKSVGRASGDIVLLVAIPDNDLAHSLYQIRVAEHVGGVVVVVAHSGVDAYHAGKPGRVIACVLERSPSKL